MELVNPGPPWAATRVPLPTRVLVLVTTRRFLHCVVRVNDRREIFSREVDTRSSLVLLIKPVNRSRSRIWLVKDQAIVCVSCKRNCFTERVFNSITSQYTAVDRLRHQRFHVERLATRWALLNSCWRISELLSAIKSSMQSLLGFSHSLLTGVD